MQIDITGTVINVEQLKSIKQAQADISIKEAVDPAAQGYAELIPASELIFDGKIENTGKFLQLSGEVEMQLKLTCGRCLKDFIQTVKAEVQESYTNLSELIEEDEEDELNFFSGDEIDLQPALYKALFAEMPMLIICKEDCQGLCHVCGADLNEGDCGCDRDDIDVRLLDLKKFLNNTDEEV